MNPASAPAARPVPVRNLKMHHLRLLAEVLASGQLGLAAQRLGITQPAASRLLAEAERLTGQELHLREGRGLRLTPVGEVLARRAARIQLEIADAAREMAEVSSGAEGHVRIGAVTAPALNRVLPVVHDMRRSHPGITFEVTVLTSDQLCDRLLAGQLDFAIGRLPSPALARNLQIEMLEDEPLSLIARRGHPLLLRGRIEPWDLMDYDWVMPEGETLITRRVNARLAELGLPAPRQHISTASFLFTFALLSASDAIAPLASAVAETYASGALAPFAQVPVDLGLRVDPYGLIRRRGAELPPAALRTAERIMARNEARQMA